MKAIILCFLSVLGNAAFAQFSDSLHYYTGYTSTGSINKTDGSNAYLLNNMLKLGVKKKLMSLNSATSWVYGAQENNLTNNDFNSSLDFDINEKNIPRLYYWGLGNYAASYSLKINKQYQGGAGLAYNIIDKKDLNLNISDGILYENSDVVLADSIRDIYSTFRNSLRLVFMWSYKSIIVLKGTTFFQNSLDNQSDYIVKSNITLAVKLQKWLSITAAYTYNKFNRTQKENTLFTYGLTVERYY